MCVNIHLNNYECLHSKSLQSCLTLCDSIHCSPPGSLVHRIFQAKNWSGLPCPPPGDLPAPGTKPTYLMSPALACGFSTTRTMWEAPLTKDKVMANISYIENGLWKSKGRNGASWDTRSTLSKRET